MPVTSDGTNKTSHGLIRLRIVRELSQGINTKLVIWSLQTSSSVRHSDVCLKVWTRITRPRFSGQHHLQWAWFGLKIKFLLVLTKLSWEILALNNGFGIYASPKPSIIMVIRIFSLLRNIVVIVKRKDKVNPSLELALNTKMHVLKGPFKQSCTWQGPSWSMSPCIGQIVNWMIFVSGPLRWSSQFGSIIVFQLLGWDLLLWNWQPRSGLTIEISSTVMCGDAWCMF